MHAVLDYQFYRTGNAPEFFVYLLGSIPASTNVFIWSTLDVSCSPFEDWSHVWFWFIRDIPRDLKSNESFWCSPMDLFTWGGLPSTTLQRLWRAKLIMTQPRFSSHILFGVECLCGDRIQLWDLVRAFLWRVWTSRKSEFGLRVYFFLFSVLDSYFIVYFTGNSQVPVNCQIRIK